MGYTTTEASLAIVIIGLLFVIAALVNEIISTKKRLRISRQMIPNKGKVIQKTVYTMERARQDDNFLGSKYDNIITEKKPDGTIRQYIGGCTVWRTFPDFDRVDTMGEGKLSQIEEWINYHKKPYTV